MLFEHIGIMDENLDYQPDCFVGTEGAFITYVGTEEPQDAARFGARYDGTGKLLMSAFYNTHAHTPMTLLRGYAENVPLQQWLNNIIWPFEGKMKFDHDEWGCKLAQAEMLRYGVVSYSDMYFATIERAKATLEAGMKANHCDGGTMCFVETDYDTLPVAAVNRQLISEFHNADDGRVKVEICVHGEYTTPEGMIRRCIKEAAENNLGLHIHLSETAQEVEECKGRRNGMSPVDWFESLGAFDVRTTAAHCVHLGDHDIETLAAKGVNVSLNPASNCKLGSGIARVADLIDAGVRCTMGTDGVASNNTHNILQSAYLLGCLAKGSTQDPSIVSAKDLLRMLTVNGAKAQGREDCGVLAEGKRADLIVMDVDTPWMRPVHDMATNLIYSSNAADIVLTMCDGKVLYENGDWKTIDIERTAAECDRCIDEVLTALYAEE